MNTSTTPTNDEWFTAPTNENDNDTTIQVGEFVIDDEPTSQQQQSKKNKKNNNEDSSSSPFSFFGGDSLQTQMATSFAKNMFQSAKAQAPSGFMFLKPYFDHVDEQHIFHRIRSTLYKPLQPLHDAYNEPDLYGPVMAVLTFALILAFALKADNTEHVFSGALLVTSLMTSLFYWIGGSVLYYALGRILALQDNSFISTLSVLGYQLYPVSLIALVTAIIPSHFVFYLLWFTVGVLSALSFGRTFMIHASNRKAGYIVLASFAAIHLLFILYVRYAFIGMYNVVIKTI
jgi:hypothetical protein